MSENLTENQVEVLENLISTHESKTWPQRWATPLDLGGTNGSHHSNTLNALARRGLVQFKQRGAPEPPPGENGKKHWASRGSKEYRITEAGRAALAVWKSRAR